MVRGAELALQFFNRVRTAQEGNPVKEHRALLLDAVGRRQVELGEPGHAVAEVEKREPQVLVVGVVRIVPLHRHAVEISVAHELRNHVGRDVRDERALVLAVLRPPARRMRPYRERAVAPLLCDDRRVGAPLVVVAGKRVALGRIVVVVGIPARAILAVVVPCGDCLLEADVPHVTEARLRRLVVEIEEHAAAALVEAPQHRLVSGDIHHLFHLVVLKPAEVAVAVGAFVQRVDRPVAHGPRAADAVRVEVVLRGPREQVVLSHLFAHARLAAVVRVTSRLRKHNRLCGRHVPACDVPRSKRRAHRHECRK